MRPSRTLPRPQAEDEMDPDALAAQIREEAIREVVDHAKRFTRDVERAKPIVSWRSRPFILAMIALPMAIITAWTLTAQAEWAYGPDPARVSPVVREAHTRVAMFLLAQRLHAYRSGEGGGTLPSSPLELGEEWPGITYEVVSPTVFRLSATPAPGQTLTYQSDQDARDFLGGSRNQLRERQP